MARKYEAVVIGGGHNGLTCASYLAAASLKTLVLEQYHVVVGMTITEEITLPGFRSDIHTFGYQLANLSPAPRELGLERFGFELLKPDPNFSHVFPDGGIVSMYRTSRRQLRASAGIQKGCGNVAKTVRQLPEDQGSNRLRSEFTPEIARRRAFRS